MKRKFLAILVLVLAATAQAQDRPAHPYAMQKAAPVAQADAPDWFDQLPEDTPDMLFSAGTSTSMNRQQAYRKAQFEAEKKLVEMMNSRIKTLTKSQSTDTGDSFSETTTTVTQKFAEGDLIGAQRVNSKTTFDGKLYTVYVLVRYPLAENNVLRKEREAIQLRKEATQRGARAQQELEKVSAARKTEVDAADRLMKQELGPVSPPAESATKVTPVVVGPAPETVKSGTTELKLLEAGRIQPLDVDNVEYKQKRAETITKPGAVIGQMTISSP
jgi:hypothetical protein